MEQIKRIEKMENILNQANILVEKIEPLLEEYEELLPQINELVNYYHSPSWKKDVQDDNDGKISEDVQKGILSEDGIYNLIFELQQIKEQMEELIQKK